MKKSAILLLALFNIIFLVVWSSAIAQFYNRETQTEEVHESSEGYKFISPLLACNNDNIYYNPWIIKKDLDTYIQKTLERKEVNDISYYVRLLKNWSTFWYNEDLKFIPASLVKLPLAISVMRQVPESQLNIPVYIHPTDNNNLEWDTQKDNIKAWQSYSIYQLLTEMLVHSNNYASVWLLEYLNKEKTVQTYERFWLWIVDFTSTNSLEISVKNYASFFRVLYNSSYITRSASEELLNLLSQSSFDLWITAYLPKDLVVANKFWLRALPDWEKHVHDCWIVYLEDNPYLLCVMTRWHNEEEQFQTIRDISKMVYDDISTKKK